MDGGVRETTCTHCIHREVCLYKQTYLEYLRASEKMYSDYPDDISFIEKTDPNCIHYKKKSDVICGDGTSVAGLFSRTNSNLG